MHSQEKEFRNTLTQKEKDWYDANNWRYQKAYREFLEDKICSTSLENQRLQLTLSKTMDKYINREYAPNIAIQELEEWGANGEIDVVKRVWEHGKIGRME